VCEGCTRWRAFPTTDIRFFVALALTRCCDAKRYWADAWRLPEADALLWVDYAFLSSEGSLYRLLLPLSTHALCLRCRSCVLLSVQCCSPMTTPQSWQHAPRR
jgi:hypothetical protein